MTTNILQHPEFDGIASQYEEREGLPRGTLRSLIHQESRGNPAAVSPVGARGVAQFMPATAKAYNVNVADPWDSLRGAAEYLGDSVRKYGSLNAALAEYNGGPRQAKAVVAGNAPPARETQRYIEQVSSRIPAQQSVIEGAKASEDITSLVARLYEAGLGEEIQFARDRGYSDREIVEKIGGEAYALKQRNNDKANAIPVLDRALLGAKYLLEEKALGVKQRLASGDEAKRLGDQYKVLQSDDARRAINNTTAAKVGRLAPELGAYASAAALAPVSGGASIAAMGAIGAADGLTDPTESGNVDWGNVTAKTTLAAAAPVAAKAFRGVVNVGGKAVSKAVPRLSNEGEQIALRLEAQGITPNRAIIAQNESKTVGGALLSTEDDAARAATQQQLHKAILDHAGVTGETSLSRAAVEEARSLRNALYQQSVKEPLEIGGARASFKGASIAAEVQHAVRQAFDDLGTAAGRSRAASSGVFGEIEKIVGPIGKDRFATLEPINNAVKDLKKLARSGSLSQPEQAAARTVADKLEQSMLKRMTGTQQRKYGHAARQTQAVKILEDLVSKVETKGLIAADDITRAARRAVRGRVDTNPYYQLGQDFKKAESVQSSGKWTERMGSAIANSLGNRAVTAAAGAVIGGPAGAVVGATGIGQSAVRAGLNAVAQSNLAKVLLQRGAVARFTQGRKANAASAALIEALKSRERRT